MKAACQHKHISVGFFSKLPITDENGKPYPLMFQPQAGERWELCHDCGAIRSRRANRSKKMNKREKIKASKASYVEPNVMPERCGNCKHRLAEGFYAFLCNIDPSDDERYVSEYGVCSEWEEQENEQ